MISIAPQLLMNVLQTMNTKRDTLEKRAFIKNQFQETTISSSNHTTMLDTGARVPLPPHMSAVQDYTPSVEDQYLPKSLRGTSNNPYSIMNAMTEQVSIEPTAVAAAIMSSTNELETSIISATAPIIAPGSAEYISTQKDPTITE